VIGSSQVVYELHVNGLMNRLPDILEDQTGHPYVLYRDPAFDRQHSLMSSYKRVYLIEEQKQFNKSISTIREYIKWESG